MPDVRPRSQGAQGEAGGGAQAGGGADHNGAVRHVQAHGEDTRFFVHALQRGGHHGIANQAIVLLAEAEHGLNRAEVYRRLVRLQESWRCEGRPAADEAGFWRKCRQLGARDRGKDYRQLRDHVVDEIRRTCDRRSTRAWTRDPADWEDQRSDVVTSTIKLVRVARTICPWIDALQPTGNIPEVQ